MSYFYIFYIKLGIKIPLFTINREYIPVSRMYYPELLDFYNDNNIL